MDANRFDLQPHLDLLHARDRRLAFPGGSEESVRIWRRRVRERLGELLGLDGRERPARPSAEAIHREVREGFVERKFALDVGEGVSCPVYVLEPEGPPPFKPIVVAHGHTPSVQPVIDRFPDDAAREDGHRMHRDYAAALARAGYLVCAIEQRGFGERRSRDSNHNDGAGGRNSSCRAQSFHYLLAGRTLLGERIWDARCAIDWLRTREDLVPDALGCTGNSGGGTVTLWLSALEERVTVAVPSCYFCSFRASILGVFHCECNYVPGILAEMEMGDLAAAIAPRPLRCINGAEDPIFPIAATREQFRTVEEAYRLLGAGDRCSLAVHPDAHRYDRELAIEWFRKWL